MYDNRYTIYWDIFTDKQWADKQKEYERIQQEKLDLEARTVDFVQPGEQQPEVDHNLEFEDSNSTGRGQGPRGRTANNGGWFSYDMKVAQSESLILRVSYGFSRSNDVFDILINGRKIAEKAPDPNQQAQGQRRMTPTDVDYKLSDDLIKGKDKINIKFAARPEQSTGNVIGVRILKEKK
jgi:hypothetical protein